MRHKSCSNRIEKKLNKLDDVNAQVNLTTEKATVEYNPDLEHAAQVIPVISNVVFFVLATLLPPCDSLLHV
jgi:Cu+-exporting ATPase